METLKWTGFNKLVTQQYLHVEYGHQQLKTYIPKFIKREKQVFFSVHQIARSASTRTASQVMTVCQERVYQNPPEIFRHSIFVFFTL